MLKREETTLPNIEFTTATGNFSTERKPITQIIIHSTVGSVQSAINRFGRIGSKVSAHYIIGNDGKLYQGLEEYYTAFHSGNWEVNLQSIGIECEWYPGLTLSDKLYETAAKLVADICKFYGLGVNRGVIKGHKEIVPTACPNAIDVDRIVREAQKLVAPKPTYEELEQKIKDLQATEERLKREKETIQKEKDRLLAEKERECQQKLQDYKQKVLNLVRSLSDNVNNL